MKIIKKYIYDLPTRLMHAGISGLFLMLFLTSKLAKIYYENGSVKHLFWIIHIYLGFTLCILLGIRVYRLFFGPIHTRLKDLINISELIKIYKKRKIVWNWGHHPLAGIAYFLVYIVLLILIYSGMFLARIKFDLGLVNNYFYDEVLLIEKYINIHEIASNLLILFTIIHLLALLWHQSQDGVPIFSSMFNGIQYKKTTGSENEKSIG